MTINSKLCGPIKSCGLINPISIHTIFTIIQKKKRFSKTFYQMNNGVIWTPYRKIHLRIINFKQFLYSMFENRIHMVSSIWHCFRKILCIFSLMHFALKHLVVSSLIWTNSTNTEQGCVWQKDKGLFPLNS